ncbi:MAG: ATP-dependent Clp protease proteolytic subunit [Planctomycetota bacterium]|jgi:membrane-bound serine protease (ClpP class)|nr:ATP-dependent Clp protease proteolytic subunit [Planctomycetota bacterium]
MFHGIVLIFFRLAVLSAAFLPFAPPGGAGEAGGAAPAKPAWADEDWKDKVVAIPVIGAIVGKPFSEMAGMVAGALEKAEGDGARLVVLEIDSPGGEVGACDTLSNKVFKLKIPVVSLVLHKAVSGGAMIASAAREIVMVRGSRIGDIQPMQASVTGAANAMDDRTAEKIEVDIRTTMKVFAEHYGRPTAVVEGMVSRAFAVYQVRLDNGRTEYLTGHELEVLEANIEKGRESRRVTGTRIIKPEGQLLELSPASAVEYGLASEIVEDADSFYAARGIDREERVRPAIAEGEIDLKKLLPSLDDLKLPVWVIVLLGVFLVVGVAGIATEFHAPGSGIPLAIGIIGFVCFFSTLIMHDRGSPVGIAMFLIGIGLLVVEIMVLPGFGFSGIAGIVCILAGLLLAFTPDWGSPYMAKFMWNEVGSFAIILFIGIVAAFVAIWIISEYGEKLPFLGRLFLIQEQEAGVNPYPEMILESKIQSTNEHIRALVGKFGTAETMLRPAGKVRLDSGELLDVVTDGVYIEAGGRVGIIEASGRVMAIPERRFKQVNRDMAT